MDQNLSEYIIMIVAYKKIKTDQILRGKGVVRPPPQKSPHVWYIYPISYMDETGRNFVKTKKYDGVLQKG